MFTCCLFIYFTVQHKEGKVVSINHIKDIEALPSVKKCQLFYDVGDTVQKSVDIRTDSGYVLLYHKDAQQLRDDFKMITEKYQNNIFNIDT